MVAVPQVDGRAGQRLRRRLATSSSVSSTVVGTPAATPDASPKLLVMSLRTTPLSASTFGPLEPSPGNGPPVSSGTLPAVRPWRSRTAEDEPPQAASAAVVRAARRTGRARAGG